MGSTLIILLQRIAMHAVSWLSSVTKNRSAVDNRSDQDGTGGQFLSSFVHFFLQKCPSIFKAFLSVSIPVGHAGTSSTASVPSGPPAKRRRVDKNVKVGGNGRKPHAITIYLCPDCPFFAQDRTTFQNHEKIHLRSSTISPGYVKCPECQAVVGRAGLWLHLSIHDPSYKGSLKKSGLLRHKPIKEEPEENGQ